MHLCFSFFILMVKVDQINELLGFAKIAMVVGYAVVGGFLEAPAQPTALPTSGCVCSVHHLLCASSVLHLGAASCSLG